MKRSYTIDTGALAVYFAVGGEAKRYFDEIFAGRTTGLISAVTLSEYFYKACRQLGAETAEVRTKSVRASLRVLETDEATVRAAGQLKCKHAASISLADAYAAATSILHKSTLLTTDGPLARLPEVDAVLLPIP